MWLLQVPYVNETLQFLSICIWHIVLSTVFSSLLHVVCIRMYIFLRLDIIPLNGSHFVNAFVDGYLSFFHHSAVMNSTAIEKGMHQTTSILLGIYLAVGLLHCVAILPISEKLYYPGINYMCSQGGQAQVQLVCP